MHRCIYDIHLSPQLASGKTVSDLQHIEVLIPGPPDPPMIWQRSVTPSEFVIEWVEPKLYACKLIGYQVIL